MKCYEYSQDGVSLNSFDCFFFIKKLGAQTKWNKILIAIYKQITIIIRGYVHLRI